LVLRLHRLAKIHHPWICHKVSTWHGEMLFPSQLYSDSRTTVSNVLFVSCLLLNNIANDGVMCIRCVRFLAIVFFYAEGYAYKMWQEKMM
jgi:hypothetical protein